MALDYVVRRAGLYPLSRYRRVYEIHDGGFRYLDLPVLGKIEEGSGDIYHTVLAEEEDRPDVIAYKYYGNVAYWWVVVFANPELINPHKVPAGMVLRIPSMESLYSADGVLA